MNRPLYKATGEYIGARLRRLNTVTGNSEFASEPEVSGFMLDFQGKTRLAAQSNAVNTTLFYREPVSGKWRELASYGTYTGAKDKIVPLGFGPDSSLYVVANAGQDTSSLRTFDFVAGQVSKEALVVTKGYDFDGSLVASDKLLGVLFTTDAKSNMWFDPAMKEIQKAVDLALPATVNLLTVPARPGSSRVLIESYSDTQPAQFILYDSKTGQFDPVGSAYPKIQGAAWGGKSRCASRHAMDWRSRAC
ncbi:hypothetical protein [Massilia sp. TWR1-2-2]|uniref:hypothetical protein n=1 Tax=Massilia sp. TWR1-2-2 TaxID=2804584 RepID=UPI003CF85039